MTREAPRPWRLRFRITTLLWLMVLAATFFCGRQSDRIEKAAAKWWQCKRVRWGGSVADTEVICWPPGSITINEPVPIQKAVNYDPQVTTVTFLATNQMQISPKSDGKTVVSYSLSGGGHHEFDCQVENGQFVMDWMLSQR